MLNAAVHKHITTHRALRITSYEGLFGSLPNFARCQNWTMVVKEEKGKRILNAQVMDRLSPDDVKVDDFVVVFCLDYQINCDSAVANASRCPALWKKERCISIS